MEKLKGSIVFSFVFLLLGCGKEERVQNGSNNMIYERDYIDHYKIDVAPMVQKETFVIGDVDIYRDILGQVAQNTNGSTNDKPDWVRKVTISNTKLSEYITIGLTNDNTNLSTNLVNCQLFYTYYPIDNSGEKKVLLANFVEYKAADKKVVMQPIGDDLTSLFSQQQAGGQLQLSFQFGSVPHTVGKMRLWYSIPFKYNYSFSSMEAKKK